MTLRHVSGVLWAVGHGLDEATLLWKKDVVDIWTWAWPKETKNRT